MGERTLSDSPQTKQSGWEGDIGPVFVEPPWLLACPCKESIPQKLTTCELNTKDTKHKENRTVNLDPKDYRYLI